MRLKKVYADAKVSKVKELFCRVLSQISLEGILDYGIHDKSRFPQTLDL